MLWNFGLRLPSFLLVENLDLFVIVYKKFALKIKDWAQKKKLKELKFKEKKINIRKSIFILKYYPCF